MDMTTTGTAVPEEWQNLACDWRTTWGRCYEPATHGLFTPGTTTPLAARCAKHIEAQRAATASEQPAWTLEVRPLLSSVTPLEMQSGGMRSVLDPTGEHDPQALAEAARRVGTAHAEFAEPERGGRDGPQ
jgi:hypothetical protein